jgi:hypothetical protein
MSDTEYRDFVAAGTRTAKWAATRRDGRPHVVPVWFVLEGDDLLITTGSKSVKGRAVLRDCGSGCTTMIARRTRCPDRGGAPASAPIRMRCCVPHSTPAGLSGRSGRRTVGSMRRGCCWRITPEKVVNNITGEQEQPAIMSNGQR